MFAEFFVLGDYGILAVACVVSLSFYSLSK